MKMKIFVRLIRDENGTTLLRYGLFIAVAAIIVAATVLAIINNIN
jgi:Flp pilus assembly pilin Flp